MLKIAIKILFCDSRITIWHVIGTWHVYYTFTCMALPILVRVQAERRVASGSDRFTENSNGTHVIFIKGTNILKASLLKIRSLLNTILILKPNPTL